MDSGTVKQIIVNLILPAVLRGLRRDRGCILLDTTGHVTHPEGLARSRDQNTDLCMAVVRRADGCL